MTQKERARIEKIAENFQFKGTLVDIRPWGNGHINDTYLMGFEIDNKECVRYILQRINKNVFPKPEEVMENVVNVTTHLHKKIVENGGDPYRETLNIIPAKSGMSYYKESDENYWRAMIFITDASSHDVAENAEEFYQSAVAFGRFQSLLADFPAEELHETIKNFHNTKSRFDTFKKALEEDVADRAKYVKDEIQFVLDREKDASYFVDLIDKHEVPIRVTHNDTKLNNIMIDNQTHEGICVIDLDTTMPGIAMYDFGDSIRFGASTGEEDEKDLSKISCSMELFEAYTKGFIEGCDGKLTEKEIELLPMGAKVLTYECGMRFLTDYLQNDVYFKTSRKEHNLDRARTQFKLVADMEKKWNQMQSIVKKYNKKSKIKYHRS